MATIKQIERLLIKNQKERSKLNNQLEDLKVRQILPGLKKKYEGKYFKYDNGYNAETRWWVYSYCKTVLSEWEAVIETFELVPGEGWRFNPNYQGGIHLFQKEITAKEYDKAAIQLVSAAKGFIALKD